MKVYAVHTTKVETQDLIDMLSRFPEAPYIRGFKAIPRSSPKP